MDILFVLPIPFLGMSHCSNGAEGWVNYFILFYHPCPGYKKYMSIQVTNERGSQHSHFRIRYTFPRCRIRAWYGGSDEDQGPDLRVMIL